MDANTVGRTFKWARERAGMTQHQLASAAEMAQPSIARIEAGRVIPRTAALIALLEATGHQLAVEPIGPPVPSRGISQRLAMEGPARTWTAIGRRVAKNPLTSPIRILRRLRRFGVPFVLLGDLAEVAHGSPLKVGRVIEVCHARTDAAHPRLDRALEDLGATTSDGVEFATEAGTFRLATEAATGDDYEVLARTAVRMHVDSGILVRVASLEDLIRIRMARCTAADREAAAVLRAVTRLSAATRSSGG